MNTNSDQNYVSLQDQTEKQERNSYQDEESHTLGIQITDNSEQKHQKESTSFGIQQDDNNNNEKQQDKNAKPKAKNPGKTMKRLLSYAWKNKGLLFLGLFSLAISSLGSVLTPYLSGKITNIIATDKSISELNKYCLIFLGVSAVTGLFSFFRGFSFNLLGEKVMYNVRNDLYEKILHKDTEFFDVNKSGELMSRITSDTTLLQSAASDNISMMLRNIVQLVGSFAFLWYLSYKLTLIMLALVPIVVICVGIFMMFYKRFTVQYQDELSKANGYATEAIGNVRVVKSFATEKKEIKHFRDQLWTTYIIGYRRSVLYGSFIGIISTIGMFVVVTILYFGGKMVIDGSMSIGDLSGFVLYTITLSVGLIGTGNTLNTFVTAMGIGEKLFEIMDHETKIQSGILIPEEVKGELAFNEVVFSYPTKDDVTVLDGVNATIPKGTSVAIVGHSGSGKSSMISLIERFYDVNGGKITLDGNDIKDLDSEWFHQQIGFVSQEPTLFSGTLKENIVYGVDQYTQEDITKAITMANALNFINDGNLFPLGLETIVGERGVKLSGGQKQRIAIARALIKNPSILIFDEATSALDAESEYQVQYAIDELVKKGDKTIVIIAHRLSTIINSDKIIVLQHGKIVEEGTHNELLKKNKYYAKLVHRQISQYNQNNGSSSDLDNNNNETDKI